MTKRIRSTIVLGLRATPEQRAWLNAYAAQRGMSLQALFDEILREKFKDSPWSRPGEVLESIPIEAQASVSTVCDVYRRGRQPLIELVETLCQWLERVLKLGEDV